MNYTQAKLGVAVAEAEVSSVREMWDARKHQPTTQRRAKAAVGAVLQSKLLRDYALKHVVNNNPYSDYLEGYTYLGVGMEQVVYRKGDQVLKFVHDSNGHFNGIDLHDVAEKLQTETDQCKALLGDRWVSTDFDVVTETGSGLSSVVAYQPFIAPEFSFGSMTVLSADTAIPSEEKREFADQLSELHTATLLHADVLGQHNVFATGDARLTILDTIPVDASVQETIAGDGRTVAEHIVERIDLLRAA